MKTIVSLENITVGLICNVTKTLMIHQYKLCVASETSKTSCFLIIRRSGGGGRRWEGEGGYFDNFVVQV